MLSKIYAGADWFNYSKEAAFMSHSFFSVDRQSFKTKYWTEQQCIYCQIYGTGKKNVIMNESYLPHAEFQSLSCSAFHQYCGVDIFMKLGSCRYHQESKKDRQDKIPYTVNTWTLLVSEDHRAVCVCIRQRGWVDPALKCIILARLEFNTHIFYLSCKLPPWNVTLLKD